MDRFCWCECARALRNYFSFENKLYEMNIDFSSSEAGKLADAMIKAMGDGDEDWAYDRKADVNWLITWASAEAEQFVYRRTVETDSGIEVQDICLVDEEDVYEFITQMRENDWPEEVDYRWSV